MTTINMQSAASILRGGMFGYAASAGEIASVLLVLGYDALALELFDASRKVSSAEAHLNSLAKRATTEEEAAENPFWAGLTYVDGAAGDAAEASLYAAQAALNAATSAARKIADEI